MKAPLIVPFYNQAPLTAEQPPQLFLKSAVVIEVLLLR